MYKDSIVIDGRSVAVADLCDESLADFIRTEPEALGMDRREADLLLYALYEDDALVASTFRELLGGARLIAVYPIIGQTEIPPGARHLGVIMDGALYISQ